MFTTSKRKEELLKLKKENEELIERNYELKMKLRSARDIIGTMAININHNVSKEDYGEHNKARILYHLLADNQNDIKTIKRFFPWVLPKDEI